MGASIRQRPPRRAIESISVIAGPCNGPRSNRRRTRASLISVIAGPRFEPATEAQRVAPAADLWITASQVMWRAIQRPGQRDPLRARGYLRDAGVGTPWVPTTRYLYEGGDTPRYRTYIGVPPQQNPGLPLGLRRDRRVRVDAVSRHPRPLLPGRP